LFHKIGTHNPNKLCQQADTKMADTKVRKQAGRKRKRRQSSEQLPKGTKRTETVGVRLSKAEKEELLAQVKRQHSQMGTILRNAWLGKEPTTVPMPEVLGPAAPPQIVSTAALADYQQVVAVAIRLNNMKELLQPDSQLAEEAGALFGELRHLLQQLVPPRPEKKIV
jgi:hypothetical protein